MTTSVAAVVVPITTLVVVALLAPLTVATVTASVVLRAVEEAAATAPASTVASLGMFDSNHPHALTNVMVPADIQTQPQQGRVPQAPCAGRVSLLSQGGPLRQRLPREGPCPLRQLQEGGSLHH